MLNLIRWILLFSFYIFKLEKTLSERLAYKVLLCAVSFEFLTLT